MSKIKPKLKGKGQATRLGKQHKLAGGPLGIFGKEAQKHDAKVSEISPRILKKLEDKYPHLRFKFRDSLPKKEIHAKLVSLNQKLGQVLFVKNASLSPDGGIIEVEDKQGNWRVILVGEAKHQGNDIEFIEKGELQGKKKDKDLMVAGNAIERVHKNILEIRNFMLDEDHFPYVVFLQGTNFATKTFFVERPDGRKVKIVHDSGALNRIDRVTASNFGMKINQNHCRNIFVKCGKREQMLQVPSLYFQCPRWSTQSMMTIMWDVAVTSLEVLSESIPQPVKKLN
ncbi:MAG: restriction endonuclease [Crenarchaeota archaeon]|nr:restriction endonuclease [Thermoproteota archaeon]